MGNVSFQLRPRRHRASSLPRGGWRGVGAGPSPVYWNMCADIAELKRAASAAVLHNAKRAARVPVRTPGRKVFALETHAVVGGAQALGQNVPMFRVPVPAKH